MRSVAANADVAFTFEKAGYPSTIYAIHTTEAEPDRARWTEVVMFEQTIACTNWSMYGIECPPTRRGLLWLQTVSYDPTATFLPPAIGGVSATFTPPTDQGPYYPGANGIYDPTKTATIAARPHIYAAFDPEADQTVALSHTSYSTCGHLDGGWQAGTNTLSVPI
jgi:hypothetical protein